MITPSNATVLLLGAKSADYPLESIPRELSSINQLFEDQQTQFPLYQIKYEPYLTRELLSKQLEKLANRVAILHFAGHSDKERLVTNDEIVYSHHIADILNTWTIPPALIFLNGCENLFQAKAFLKAGVSVVIATYQPINDEKAAEFAHAFYDSLFAEKADVSLQDAFDRAGRKVFLDQKNPPHSFVFNNKDENTPELDELDWGLFTKQAKILKTWTIKSLLTNDRPVLDKQGQLLNPYKGLEAFQEQDTQWFFGREHISQELSEQITNTRFFSLLGASGSGKSSLINAGVIPKLRGNKQSLILHLRPGAAPFAELTDALSHTLYPESVSQRLKEQKQLTADLKSQQITLVELINAILDKTESQHVLLFIDQFEELFTHSEYQLVQGYLEQLVHLIQSDTHCTLTLIMRADFLAPALANPELAELIDRFPHKLLSPMSKAELREAIEKPANKQHIQLEPALIDALLDDVEDQAGSLPLLQYVLSLLWEKRQGNNIELQDYTAFGGLEKALETRANEIYQNFSKDEQQHCKQIFLRLIQPGDGTEDTRRRAYLDEFDHQQESQRVVKTLADARLISTQTSHNSKQAFAEVSHEALIRHWSQLKEWIAEERDQLRLQHQISQSAKEWEQNSKNSDWLLTGTRLQVAQEWQQQNHNILSQIETEFLNQSTQQQQEQIAKEKAEQEKKERLLREKAELQAQQVKDQRKALVKTRWFSGLMAVLTVFMLIVAWFAFKSSEEANKNLLNANYNLAKVFEKKVETLVTEEVLTGKKEPNIKGLKQAVLYSLEAARQKTQQNMTPINPNLIGRLSFIREQDLSTEYKLISPLTIKLGLTAYSPDGRYFISQSGSELILWNANTGGLLKKWVDQMIVNSVVFSPNSKYVVTGGFDKTVRIWNVNTGKLVRIFKGHANPVKTITFSPDGKYLASASSDETVRIWGVNTGKLVRILKDSATTLIYSPDGNYIASGSSDKTIRIWNAHTGIHLKTLQGHTGIINTLVYSFDGKYIISGSDDNTIKVWDSVTGKNLRNLRGHTASILTIACSPNGKYFVSGSSDHTISVWDINTGERLKHLRGHSDRVNFIAFLPNGNSIFSGSWDGTIRTWDVYKGKELTDLRSHSAGITSIAYSPNGKYFVSASYDDTLKIWDNATGQLLNILKGHTDSVNTVAYSSNGRNIVSGSFDSTIRVWDALTGELLKTFQHGHGNSVNTIAYSPNGKHIVSGSSDNTIHIWNVDTGENLKILRGHKSAVSSVAYSPNGKHIVSGSSDNTIHIWNVDTGKSLKILRGHTDDVSSVTYSPSGKLIASDSWNRTILWDANTGKSVRIFQEKNLTSSITFSPDSKFIASGSFNNTIKIWNVNSGENIKTLQGHHSEINAIAYSPDGKYIVSGSIDSALRIWELDSYNKSESHKIFSDHNHSVDTVAISPNNKFIASGSSDNSTIRIWNVNTGKSIQTLQKTDSLNLYDKWIRSIVFSPDGKFIAYAKWNEVRIDDVSTGRNIIILKGGEKPIESISYSSDGKFIAGSSRQDNKLWIWNTNTGENLHTLSGHVGDIESIAYSPDSKFIAIALTNYNISVWNTVTEKYLTTMKGHHLSVKTMAYSPDGKYIASGSSDNTIRVWDAMTGESLKTIEGHRHWLKTVVYSPDGKLIASGSSDKTIRIWNASTGENLKTLEGHSGKVLSLAYSPNGKFIASGSSDGTVRIWELTSPIHRLLFDFNPAEVSDALGFIWQMGREGLEIVDKPHPPSLFPQMGYHISFTDKTRKYRPLLDMPRPDETKLEQVVRFLEERCAYKHPERYGCTPVKD